MIGIIFNYLFGKSKSTLANSTSNSIKNLNGNASTTDTREIMYILKLVMEALNIGIPFSTSVQISRLLEMDKEFEKLSDDKVKKIIENIVPGFESVVKILNNKKTLDLLKSKVQFQLGAFYQQNGDKILSFEYFEKASHNGNLDAIYNLACLYGMGLGVNKNEVKSFQLMLMCAEAGINEAAFPVAQQYLYGNGVERNMDLAIKWLEKAALYGNAEALEILNIVR